MQEAMENEDMLKSITLGELSEVLQKYIYQHEDLSITTMPIYFDGLHIQGEIIEHEKYLELV